MRGAEPPSLAGFGPTTGRSGWWDDLLVAARDAGEDVDSGLRLAATYGRQLRVPGRGQTELRWAALAAVAAADLTAARILDAHCDALAILAEDGQPPPGGTWGVFATEAPGAKLEARRSGTTWTLHGTKPWCTLGTVLDHALVTAHIAADRQLFAVDLHQPAVRAATGERWVSRGLRNLPSGPVHFDGAPARPVDGPAWYLTRAGFAWGAMGVAACWYGGELIALSLGTR